VDLRLKFSRWLTEFAQRGGKVVIRSLNLEELDALASRHDLVLVASGKGNISRLFPRDEERSVHTAPRRNIAAMTLSGVKPWPETPFPVLKFILTAMEGEIFWMPFHDRFRGPSMCLLVEAQPGRELDCLSRVSSGEELVQRVKALAHRFAPWTDEVLKDATLVDETAWLTGAITPVVREPVARMPSGGRVMGLGDAVLLNDPVAGQGLNSASKMAHFVTQAILAHGQKPFTEEWMREVFSGFWEQEGRAIATFSNMLLETPPPHVQQVLGAASQVPAIADAFFDNFTEPQRFWPWIGDPAEAQAFIQRMSAPRA
jgi:2-polyprenyl-6-methoxyphenol hydroxylase-like FAD-dependent oxidoreductase